MTGLEVSRLPLALALTLGLAAPLGWARAASLGFVAAVQGQVEVRSSGGAGWAVAGLDRKLELGDHVRTGPASGVKILLANETILILGAASELTLGRSNEPSWLKLHAGQARVRVGETAPTSVELHTPSAVIGGEGAIFEAYVVEESAAVVWTLVCDPSGTSFARPLGSETDPTRPDQPQDCTRVARGEPLVGLPRPPGFAPVPFLSSRPAPGAGELLGQAGVAAGSGSGGKLLERVVSGGVPAADGFGGGDTELRDPYIEDAQQADTLSGDRKRPDEPPPGPELSPCPTPEPVELCPDPGGGEQ